jgi:hypothetical protein
MAFNLYKKARPNEPKIYSELEELDFDKIVVFWSR